MPHPVEDRTPPMNPQLAFRVAVVGAVALALFAIIFFRLWVLQVLTGSQYVAQAQSNATEKIAVQGARGKILASDGTVLVASQPTAAIQISPADLPVRVTDPAKVTKADPGDLSAPPAADAALYARLARLLGVSTTPAKCVYYIYPKGPAVAVPARLAPIPCKIAQEIGESPFANVTIKTDVSQDITAYLAERQSEFPGVVATEVYTRTYPEKQLAAQLFGTVGPITEAELKAKTFKNIPDTDSVGQSGLEAEYNDYLQGTDGYEKVKVNANGQFEGWASGKAAQLGDNLTLSLNAKLQAVGQASLAESIKKNYTGSGVGSGAFVAMDPQNGQVYAMGSYPSYDPSVLVKGITQKQLDDDFGKSAGLPLLNRAVEMAGPTGSTFKVITSVAALESGTWSVGDVWDDPGYFCTDGNTYSATDSNCFHNSGGISNAGGELTLTQAINVSNDDFFYHLGDLMNTPSLKGGALQKWAKLMGIGEATGVDLPGESSGLMASPALVPVLAKEELECETATGRYKGYPKHPAADGGCGIWNDGAIWTVGQNILGAVGQGLDEVTPLQLAVAYSAIENGGSIVTPHLGADITTQSGSVLERIDPAIKRKLDINSQYLWAIQQGLYDAAHSSNGTSATVMSSFGEPVYGKTGTAQVGSTKTSAESNADNAWYACYVPASATSKPIVVIVTVNGGGFGAVAAAPVARQILSQWFYGNHGAYIAGSATTGNQL